MTPHGVAFLRTRRTPPDPPVRRFPEPSGPPGAPAPGDSAALGGAGPEGREPSGRPLRLAVLHEPGEARSY
ncbi:hypothetical protein K6168_19485 [Streptomyces sp. FB2]|uniref:hypothetical protein n=1 Tax=Streptomyces sp. FB2 TaxID=2902454 RepID=UPI001F37170E|nr:hypothetical protein [Streptomyces sp. FB2]MCF2537823.1 hypothetical protein [Streptomyces sp. FB2]